jgi:GNAT superfamily N-acetyltransferase
VQNKILIIRPSRHDVPAIEELLTRTIEHTFVAEQISGDNQAEIGREIESHIAALQRDLESIGKDECFLIARHKSKVVGTIAFGRPNKIILANLEFDLLSTPEIKCAYVHPDYQQRGIGSRLFDTLVRALHKRGTTRFCLDSGYKKAQQFWTKRLGPATVILPDYFGPGAPHMIWLCEVLNLV